MLYHELISVQAVDSFIKENPLAIIYISRTDCNVCHALWPKVQGLLGNLPQIKLGYIVADQVEEIASKFTIFSVPTVLLMVEGKEYLRESRFISVEKLKDKLEKIYGMYFS